MTEHILNPEPTTPISIIDSCLTSGDAIYDDHKKSWNQIVEEVLSHDGTIIALRGPGAKNGADKQEIDTLLAEELIPRIQHLQDNNTHVTILYDGDDDVLDKPDIGYVAGRLMDRFGNNTDGVVFIVVQRNDWFEPTRTNGNFRNAHGKDYVSYVFPEHTYPDEHSSFSQCQELVSAKEYQQWYVGASGSRADYQLSDLNAKVPDGETRKAILFRIHNNKELEQPYQEKLQKALLAGDEKNIHKYTRILNYRKKLYGAHWNNKGNPRIKDRDYPNIELIFIT